MGEQGPAMNEEKMNELKEAIEVEKQKALFQAAIHKFHGMCWEK
jgi:hypothetical protein